LSESATTALSDSFARIVDEVIAMPYGLAHRDFQSKNLMVSAGGGLTVIDFQDALRGPRTYDLAALLCDSYVPLDLALQESMIDRYAALRRIDPEAVHREFWWVALHRKLKDAGRFVFIDRERRNPDFLQWFPQSLVYVGRAARRVGEMEPLCAVLEAAIPGFPDAVSSPPSSVVE
jgi:aminoglycoside/choline kinase family phosphotransferase